MNSNQQKFSSTNDQIIESNAFSDFIFKCSNDTICQSLWLDIDEPIYIVSFCSHISCHQCYNKIKSNREIEDVMCPYCRYHENYREITGEIKKNVIQICRDYDGFAKHTGLNICPKHPNVRKFWIEANHNEENNCNECNECLPALPSKSSFICESCYRELKISEQMRYISIEQRVNEFNTEIENALKALEQATIKNRKKQEKLTCLKESIEAVNQQQKQTINNVLESVKSEILQEVKTKKIHFDASQNEENHLDIKYLSLTNESDKLKGILENIERKICGLSANANYCKNKAEKIFRQEQDIIDIVEECNKSQEKIKLAEIEICEPRLIVKEEEIKEQLRKMIKMNKNENRIMDVIKNLYS